MRAYNLESGLWDWSHLGLYDVLCAMLEGGPVPACHEFALPNADFEAFYWEAMAIAAKGRATK